MFFVIGISVTTDIARTRLHGRRGPTLRRSQEFKIIATFTKPTWNFH